VGWKSLYVVVASSAVALAAASVSFGLPEGKPGCEQLATLKGVFPKAGAIGLTERKAVTRGEIRSPIWPGTCGKWFTSYHRGSAYVEVSLTLYKTHRQALVALAEPAYGPVVRLPGGALVRKLAGVAGVNGVNTPTAQVASVYRNVFIGSVSIAAKPIDVAAQMRLHRRVHAGVQALH